MKVLIKIIAIFLLLRIMGGYAQIMPSFGRLTEKPKMISAEIQTIDIVPADSTDDQKGITLEEARSVAESANPGTQTLATEIKRVSKNNRSFIYKYEVELDNDIDVEVDARNGHILDTNMHNTNYLP